MCCRAHLIEAQPEQVYRLHQRASAWYEHNGLPPEAIRHALAAEDFERAARAYRSLVLGNVPSTVKYAQQALKLTPEDDQVRHMQATSLLGLAQYTSTVNDT
jgi:hypothetical protein